MDLSVIICSHNPRPDYLRRVLHSLEAQTLPRSKWELLLVDNASSERLADTWDLSWHSRHAHVREDELGLTPARLRGTAEASGELLAFVDDDNILAPDYLERAFALVGAYPYLGVVGAGVLAPEFEVQPSPEMKPLLPLLALRTVSSGLWTNHFLDSHCIPYGAGMVVTQAVARAYQRLVRRSPILRELDRRGSDLCCGGDDLFSWVSAREGLGFGIFPELRVSHMVRAERLTHSYLLRLVQDHAYSHGVLAYLISGNQPRSLGLAGAARIALHGVRRGRFSMRCHWAAACGARRAAACVANHGLRPIENGLLPHGHTIHDTTLQKSV